MSPGSGDVCLRHTVVKRRLEEKPRTKQQDHHNIPTDRISLSRVFTPPPDPSYCLSPTSPCFRVAKSGRRARLEHSIGATAFLTAVKSTLQHVHTVVDVDLGEGTHWDQDRPISAIRNREAMSLREREKRYMIIKSDW